MTTVDIMEDVNGISQENLKKTLLGLNNYFFLINDTNHELDQHFNPNYISNFNSKSFLDNYNFKKNLFKKENIRFYLFIVPDKSVVCKKFLPFKTDTVKRNIDLIDEIVDFADCLDEDDYFQYDSHISFVGGKSLAFRFLNFIDNSFTLEKFNILVEKSNKVDIERMHDLIAEENWSYSEEFRERFPLIQIYTIPQPKGLKSITDFPEIFKWSGTRKSVYYKNDESYSNLKVLIFGDSTFKLYAPYISLYFKELFFYWDHGLFNKSLINWFKPDLILEIRMERFIENINAPNWILNKEEISFSSESLIDNLFDDMNDINIKLKESNDKIKKLKNKNKKLNNKNKKLNNKNKKLDSESKYYKNLTDEILNSNSWKITKPLRKIKNLRM